MVVDGLSMTTILKETGAIYSSICQGSSVKLALPMQHSQYTEQIGRQLDTEEMKNHEAYWLESLRDYTTVMKLPYERPRPPVQRYQGKRHTKRLGLYQPLKQVSSKHGATLFMTFLAAYATLLHHLSGEDDILVGIPVAGRPLEASESLVSYCAHLLPVRISVNKSLPFSVFLKNLKNQLLQDYDHQDYPFSRLISSLNIPRDRSRPPLVSHVFN